MQSVKREDEIFADERFSNLLHFLLLFFVSSYVSLDYFSYYTIDAAKYTRIALCVSGVEEDDETGCC